MFNLLTDVVMSLCVLQVEMEVKADGFLDVDDQNHTETSVPLKGDSLCTT